MFGGCRKEFDTFARRFGYLIIPLFVMLSLSTPAITDTMQSDMLLQGLAAVLVVRDDGDLIPFISEEFP